MSDASKENTFASGKMSLESLWRLLEQQGRTNASMASVIGLDEAKIRGQDRDTGLAKHGMTTIGNYDAPARPLTHRGVVDREICLKILTTSCVSI